MHYVELDPESLALLRAMAGDYADYYIGEHFLPALHSSTRSDSATLTDIRNALSRPYPCLRSFFAHYAFARRGRDRDDLAEMAVLALKRCTSEETIYELLSEPNGNRVWDTFAQICVERKRRNSEQLNRGLIAGMIELAQEIYQVDGIGSIAGWISQGVMQTDRIEPQFLRIVDIRGVGPKTTSSFLRDISFVFGLEEQLDHADRLYIQPIDRWTRLMAEYVVPELQGEHAADWIMAGKLAKYSRRAGVSGIRFNFGTTYFGLRTVRDVARFDPCIEEFLSHLDPKEFDVHQVGRLA